MEVYQINSYTDVEVELMQIEERLRDSFNEEEAEVNILDRGGEETDD